ncbi:MAG TPA: GtrA family protein [Prosthecobacter sp.]
MMTLAETRRFFKENDWRTILKRMNERDQHPLIQFIKYVICGFGAFFFSQIIWLALSLWVWKAIDSDIPQDVRALHSTYNNTVAFFFGNLFAYYTNSKWVFTPGRHGKVVEFLLFTAVSSVSFFVGLVAGPYLIYRYGISTLLAQLFNQVTSVMVNFVCRKFIIFKS